MLVRHIKESGCGLWATPQSRDFRTGEGHRWQNPDKSRNLNDQVADKVGYKVWPTPRVCDPEGGPTEAYNDGKGWYRVNKKGERWGVKLKDAVASALGRAVHHRGGQKTPQKGQLNPDWVEWLMGWPIGWTDLKQSAMDKFLRWWRLLGKS